MSKIWGVQTCVLEGNFGSIPSSPAIPKSHQMPPSNTLSIKPKMKSNANWYLTCACGLKPRHSPRICTCRVWAGRHCISSFCVPLPQAMSVFALRDINMTKIESRPLRSAPMQFELNSRRRSYNYLFFIDLQGSTAEASSSIDAPFNWEISQSEMNFGYETVCYELHDLHEIGTHIVVWNLCSETL